MTDSKLAREQVEALYRRHADGVHRFLLGVLRNADLAEEARQLTFLQVLEKGHTADEQTMTGWIYKVAFNQAMALRRQRQRTADAPGFDLDALLGSSVRGDEVAMDGEERRRARAAIRELPEEQQQVLRMRFVETKTFARIAEELGVPLGTALTRMRLALQKLRRKLSS